MMVRDVLKGKLGEEELRLVPRSFDIIGHVAIMELPEELLKHRKKIARAIARVHKKVRTVCLRTGDRSGEYRLRDLEVVLGSGTETEHVEHGCRFRLDVRKAYFSERESTERKRIAGQVKPGERVLVMFSGVCPYPIVIAKSQPLVSKVVGVEINPDAHGYALENARVNKVEGKVEPVLGDVREACPGLGSFDRIVMPLPKSAGDFLGVALGCAKKGGTTHFYHIAREDDLYTEALGIIRKEARKAGRKAGVLAKRKVLPYGPRTFKVCVDFRAS